MVLHRKENRLEHRQFSDFLNFLQAGDVLVLNDSRVIPARLRGANAKTGGKFEILLVEENAPNDWWTMLKPGKNARIGTEILIQSPNASSGQERFPPSSSRKMLKDATVSNSPAEKR